MIQSILFVTSYIGAILGLLLLKKTDEKQHLGIWCGVSIMAIAGLHTMLAGIFGLLHIDIMNLFTLGIANVIVALACFITIYKTKQMQKLYVEWCDILFGILLFVVLIVFWYIQYGPEFSLHYLAVDPTAHMKHAMYVVNTDGVYGMFYAALQNAILIEIFSPVLTVGTYYIAYIIGDVLYLGIAGLMFWAVIRKYATNSFLKIAAIAITFVYLIGYPLNSTVFGFAYFGMGITIIAYLLVVADLYVSENLPKWLGIILLSFGCFGIFESYVMFMPVVFFAVLSVMLIRQYREKKLVSWDTVWTGLGIFLVPTILGLYFILAGTFINGHTASSTIAIEGGIYRDLFTNFILIVPFAAYALVKMIKEKKNSLLVILTIFEVIYTVRMFIQVLQNEASSYYYFKNYYFLWLLGLALVFMCLNYLDITAKAITTCGFVLWGMLAVVGVFNLEIVLQNKYPLLVQSQKGGILCDIYMFNRDALCTPKYSKAATELYSYVANEIMPYDDADVPLVGTWEDYQWMSGVTNHDTNPNYWYWNVGEEVFMSTLKEEANYVVVLGGNDLYNNNAEYFESLERVYSNDAGFVAKVK